MSWANDLVQALENLGGQAPLAEIYDEIKNIRSNLSSTWRATVRERIQRHSTDSDAYNPRNPNLFYSVEGLGAGIWGLRSRLTRTPKASDIDGGNESPRRVKQDTYRVLRDTSLARKLKLLHKNRCQLCGYSVELKNGETYSEAHHIIPLGTPHDGPDIANNILVLCPNCHVLCDYGAISLSSDQIRSSTGHSISKKSLNYHNRIICEIRIDDKKN